MRVRRPHGFSLIEVLVSLGIGLLAIGAALAILGAQNSSLSQQLGTGSALYQGQAAMDALERAVRIAGTGIDPQMAFDFDFYGCTLPGGALSMNESANCAAHKRDSIDAADELVLAYRDPAYSVAANADTRSGCTAGNASTYIGKVWGVVAADPSSVTLVLKPGDRIYRGQVLLLACNDGLSYTYATVNNKLVSVSSTASSCASVVLGLYPVIAHDPYNQPDFLSTSCFSAGTARAYAVRRERYFIYRDLGSASPRPYLMLDQGLDLDDDGRLTDLDLRPVASDIEDLQVSYATEQPGLLSLSAQPTGWTTSYLKDSNANGVWGDDAAATSPEQLTEPVYPGAGNIPTAQFDSANSALFAGSGQRCTGQTTNPFFQYPCILGTVPTEHSTANNIHAYRWAAWTGNIAQVLIGVVARGARQDAQTSGSLAIPALFNRRQQSPPFSAYYKAMQVAGSTPAAVSRRRMVFVTGVRPVNMSLSGQFWN